ncbi:MAG: glycerol dehydratase reactivase beta/small subunit family protein [Propionibacteriaceae bacterium]|jgi:hypothetical protein|nr:glycerol dehydratase reactivase beta/small subunit family protein [Propionibacteriaceae bacterium]
MAVALPIALSSAPVAERDRPAIVVRHDATLGRERLAEILLGVEEEGIPVRIESVGAPASDAAAGTTVGAEKWGPAGSPKATRSVSQGTGSVSATTSAAATLAHEAAVASRLGVGIGIDPTSVAVTFEKLPAATPYLTETLNRRRAADRTIGVNAARLVKRMPLRFDDEAPLSRTNHPGEDLLS